MLRLLRGARFPAPCSALASALLFVVSTTFIAFDAAARNDEIYYKDGAYTSFAITDQDTDRFGANDHPADLSPDDLEPVLRAISVRDDGLFSSASIEPLFSPQQATIMAGQLAKGLRQARADEDVVFVIQRKARKLVLLNGLALTSGRAFVVDGQLNIIIGEHDRQRNREYERLFDTTGAVQPYSLSPGKRKRNSGAVKGDLIAFEGLTNQIANGKVRKDWLVIDVGRAADTIAGQPALADGSTTAAPLAPTSDALTSEEAAALQAEQRELRAEMSRMQEELQTTRSAPSSSPSALPASVRASTPAPRTPGSGIEERLRLLIQLFDQGLITEAEYNDKRREILAEL